MAINEFGDTIIEKTPSPKVNEFGDTVLSPASTSVFNSLTYGGRVPLPGLPKNPRPGQSDQIYDIPVEDRPRFLEEEKFREDHPGKALTSEISRIGLQAALTSGGPLTAGLKFAGANKISDIIDEIIGTPRGKELIATPPMEALSREAVNITVDFLGGAILQKGSELAPRVLEGILNLPGSILRKGASKELQRKAVQAADIGVELPTGLASGAPLLRGTEKVVLQNAPFSRGMVESAFENAENQVQQAAEQKLKSISPLERPFSIGEKVQRMLKDAYASFRKSDNDNYNAIKDFIPVGSTVNTQNAQKNSLYFLLKERKLINALKDTRAESILADLSGIDSKLSASQFEVLTPKVKEELLSKLFTAEEKQELLLAGLPEDAKSILAGIPEELRMKMMSQITGMKEADILQSLDKTLADKVSSMKVGNFYQKLSPSSQEELNKVIAKKMDWETATHNRARLNDLIDRYIQAGKKDIARALIEAKNSLNADLREFAESQGGQVVIAFRKADLSHAKGAQIFEDEKIQSLLSEIEPERVARLTAKSEAKQYVEKLKSVLGVDGFKPVQRVYASEFLTAKDPYKEFGVDTLESVFGKKDLSDLIKIKETIQFIEKSKPGEDVAHVVGRNMSSKAMGMFGAAGLIVHPVAGTALLFGPASLGKFFYSDLGRKYLLEGATLSPGSRRLVEISAWLTKQAALYGLEPKTIELSKEASNDISETIKNLNKK